MSHREIGENAEGDGKRLTGVKGDRAGRNVKGAQARHMSHIETERQSHVCVCECVCVSA